MSLPANTCHPGWPEFLTDSDDLIYVLLRDGSQVTDTIGNSCIYGLIDDEGFIYRERQWLPVLGATEEQMSLTPVTWDSNEVLLAAGQPPITIPHEPIAIPDEGDPRIFLVPRPRP
jgi:hypothetical protein